MLSLNLDSDEGGMTHPTFVSIKSMQMDCLYVIHIEPKNLQIGATEKNQSSVWRHGNWYGTSYKSLKGSVTQLATRALNKPYVMHPHEFVFSVSLR